MKERTYEQLRMMNENMEEYIETLEDDLVDIEEKYDVLMEDYFDLKEKYNSLRLCVLALRKGSTNIWSCIDELNLLEKTDTDLELEQAGVTDTETELEEFIRNFF